MKNISFLSGSLVIILMFGITMFGCDNGTTIDKPDKNPNERYQIVQYNSENDENFALVSSSKTYDDSERYYVFYLGYVKNVPISYKTTYRYNGLTPIKFTWEKGTVVEESIIQSMEIAQEETWEISSSIIAGMEVESKTDFGIVETTVTGKLEAALGSSYSKSMTTTSTYETVVTKGFSETESISVTIGEKGEPAGRYRYALAGITDAFCVFVVNPVDNSILTANLVTTVRHDSLAWGIDYSPDELNFGKTGTGDKFEIPEINFSALSIPTDICASPTVICPGDCPDCDGKGGCGHSPCNCPDLSDRVFGFINIRESVNRITDDGYFSNTNIGKADLVTWERLGVNLTSLKKEGFTKASFNFRIDVREINDGYQWIALYCSDILNANQKIGQIIFEHGSALLTSWRTHDFIGLPEFSNIDINLFDLERFAIRYDASGNNDDDWENRNIRVKVIFSK